MVGLSVILESYRDVSGRRNPHRQVINKGSMIKPPQPVSPSGFSQRRPLADLPSFLDCCLFCKLKLSPGKDIFMYKGDKAFCSEECRCRQIFIDEEEEAAAARSGRNRKYNCSMAAVSSAAATSSASSGGVEKGARSGRANAFAY